MKDFISKSNLGKKIVLIFITLSIPLIIVVSTILIDYFARMYSH